MARDTRQTTAERWIFLGFCAAGIALLWLVRFEFEHLGLERSGLEKERSAVIAAAILCALVCLYAVILRARGSFRLRRNDQSADNLYFLGFLFTICALGVSLIRFASFQGATALDIVGDLGIGLSTTVVGLILRVLALHREDPAEIEDRVRGELVEVAESTTAMIRTTAGIVEQGQIITRQTIEELNRTLQQTADQIGSGMQEVRESLEAVRIPPDLIVSRLTPIVTQLADSTAAFVEKLNAIEVPADLVASRIDRATAEMTRALMEAVNRSGDEVGQRISAIVDNAADRAQQTLRTFDASISARVDAIEIPPDLLTRRVEPLLDGVDEVSARLVSSLQAMAVVVAESERALDGLLPNLGDRLATEFDEVRRRLTELGTVLAALETDGIRSLGDQMKEARVVALDDLRQMKDLAERQHGSTAQFNQRIDTLSRRLGEASVAITDGLARLEEFGRLLLQVAERVDSAEAREKAAPTRRWPFGR